jgi:hypothetical protein
MTGEKNESGEERISKEPASGCGKNYFFWGRDEIVRSDHPINFFQTAGSLAWLGHDGESLSG